jgi:demethylmenaquinone methyltransferase/2-methoxy-6-polyprenyl-1,4-benzoquinol methylase
MSPMTTSTQPDPAAQVPPHTPLLDYYPTPEDPERVRFVRELFDKSAQHYNTVELMFGNVGLLYRRFSLWRAGMRPGMKVLDVATGTGAVVRGAVKVVGPTGRVFGCDPSRGMLREARKNFSGPLSRGIAEELPFKSEQFDFVTMGIALRHVADLVATFREYLRVLRPGGKLWILESHVPKSKVGHALTRFVWAQVVPGMTYLSTRSREAKLLMDYYWDTIDKCVEPEVIVAALREAGFEAPKSQLIVPGAFCEYSGTRAKPATD